MKRWPKCKLNSVLHHAINGWDGANELWIQYRTIGECELAEEQRTIWINYLPDAKECGRYTEKRHSTPTLQKIFIYLFNFYLLLLILVFDHCDCAVSFCFHCFPFTVSSRLSSVLLHCAQALFEMEAIHIPKVVLKLWYTTFYMNRPHLFFSLSFSILCCMLFFWGSEKELLLFENESLNCRSHQTI